MTDEQSWLRTDEAEDVAASVRHALRCWALIAEDPQIWKWIALALHSALQGACVCHLVTTASPVGAVTKQNAKEWLEYFEQSRVGPPPAPPNTHLLSLPDLLKAVRKAGSAGDGGNLPGIVISDDEFCWLRRFHNQIRNQFAHFEPMGWSIEVSGMPALAGVMARIVGDILAQGWAFRHRDRAWKEALQVDLECLSSLSSVADR